MYFLVLFLYYFVGGTKTAEPVPPCTAARRGAGRAGGKIRPFPQKTICITVEAVLQ